MKKTIRFLTIASLIMYLFLAGVLFICIVFQQPLIEPLYADEFPEAMGGFTIPLGHVFHMLGLLAISATLCFTAGNLKVRELPESIGIMLIAFVLPTASNAVSETQSYILYKLFPESAETWYTLVEELCDIPLTVVVYCNYIALVACGMSIAYKQLSRKEVKDAPGA